MSSESMSSDFFSTGADPPLSAPSVSSSSNAIPDEYPPVFSGFVSTKASMSLSLMSSLSAGTSFVGMLDFGADFF